MTMGTEMDDQFRPPPEFRAAVKAKCEELLPVIREAARGVGYAIGLHGSMERDLDLIACPWVSDAVPPEDMLRAITTALQKHLGDDGVYWRLDDAGAPHRRLWGTIIFQGRHIIQTPSGAFPFLDVSIMPRDRDEIERQPRPPRDAEGRELVRRD